MLALLKTGSAALVLGALLLSPVQAVEKSTATLKSTARTAAQIKKSALGGKPTVGTVGGGTTATELSAWDCRTLGGTVVTVADDRCGASRKYCRMPDTMAACIDEVSAD